MNQILNNNILQWQPVRRQMTFPDFVTIFPRSERIKHCNFNEIKKDEGHTHIEGKRKHNFGQILGAESQKNHARENLKKLILDRYNIELIGPQTRYFPLCHLCKHNCLINDNDSTKHTCTNALHIYFGTPSENKYDVDPIVRSLAGLAAGSASAKSPKHNCQIREKCPHCGFETNKRPLQHHIKACHFNPTSKHYLTPITYPYTKNIYQEQGLGHKLIELELMIAENYNNRH